MPSAEELARRDLSVDETPWELFARDWRLKRGEHVTIIGPTGTGKTTLAMSLLAKSNHVAMAATKRTDPFFGELERRGWTKVNRWPRRYGEDSKGRIRLLVHVPTFKLDQVPKTRKVFREMLDRIAEEGDMTLYVDELMFASSPAWLDAGKHLELGWQQWRTSKISLVVSAQRASHVPMLAYDQVQHIFTFVENDLRNADRIGEMAGLDRFLVRDLVRNLEPFQCLHIATRGGGARKLETLHPPKIV